MPSLDLRFGTTIGRYHVIRRLGVGGMAEVCLAHDPRLDRDVAIKVLGDKLLDRPGYRVFLQREARAIALLNHPHIAQVYDIVDYQDRTCFVMEYVEGETLAERLQRGPLPLEEVARLGQQIASAVSHAHSHGVLHCDLKPGNIFLTRDGSAKVVDFGLARPIADGMRVLPSDIGASPTLVANRAGTPAYMAPEQYFGQPLDQRCDLYSLGVVLCEMATGRRPSAWPAGIGQGPGETTHTLLDGTGVPEPLRPILERTLAPNPLDRYQAGVELQAALERIAGPTAPAAGTPGSRSDIRAPVFQPRPALAVTLARASAWLAGILMAVTALGLLNTAAFNITLERADFAGEGVSDWFRWGLKSLVAPGALATALLIALEIATSVIRFGSRRWWPGVTTRAAGAVRRSGLNHPTALARTVAMIGLFATVAICWTFRTLLGSFGGDGISRGDPEDFAVWSSAQYLEHRHYRMAFTTLVVLMIVSLYHVVRQRRRFGPVPDRAAVATAFAVLAVAVALLNLPYRLLQQGNMFELVQVNGRACYILGEKESDLLVFCRSSEVPRNRTYPRNHPDLKRLGCFGSVFDATPVCAPKD